MAIAQRRLGLVVAVMAATAGLSLAAPRANAAQTTAAAEGVTQPKADVIAQRVAARQDTLAALNQRADARDRALIGYQDVLALYGYTADPDNVLRVMPLAYYRVSAGFGQTGPLWESEHGGQDFGAYAGDQIVAVADGTVTEVATAGPYGLRTILTLEDGTEVWYCHQTSVTVTAGDIVEVADEIGTVGSTGNSTGPHLHLEVRPDGDAPIDPMDWLTAGGLTP